MPWDCILIARQYSIKHHTCSTGKAPGYFFLFALFLFWQAQNPRKIITLLTNHIVPATVARDQFRKHGPHPDNSSNSPWSNLEIATTDCRWRPLYWNSEEPTPTCCLPFCHDETVSQATNCQILLCESHMNDIQLS